MGKRMKWIWMVIGVMFLPLIVLCRAFNHPCPYCGSKFMVELLSEWDGEDYKCHNCGNYFNLPIKKER